MTEIKAVDPHNWIPVSQAARMLNRSIGTVNRMVTRGKLQAVTLPDVERSRLVWKPTVERILQERKQALKPPEDV